MSKNTKEVNVEETTVEETVINEEATVEKSPGRPVIPGSKRQLLLQKKEMLLKAGVLESGRPINIEKTELEIDILKEKVKKAKLREKLEMEIDKKLGIK